MTTLSAKTLEPISLQKETKLRYEKYLEALTDLSIKHRVLICGAPKLSDMEDHDYLESYGTNSAHDLVRLDLSMVA